MEKYSCYFMENGRIVFVNNEDIDKALEQDKEILVVHNAWSGGYSFVIGADAHPDYYGDGDNIVYDMYTRDVKNEEFTSKEMEQLYKIIVTSGEMVFMETGEQANSYQGGEFIDYHSEYKNIFKNETEEEYNKKRMKVDYERTIRGIQDKEKINSLRGYGKFYGWSKQNK